MRTPSSSRIRSAWKSNSGRQAAGRQALVASRFGLPQVLAPAVAFLVGCLIGAVAERVVARRLYGRPLDAILATWGLSIVIGQLVTLGFGREVQFVPAPVSGTLAIFSEDYSSYRLLLVVAIR